MTTLAATYARFSTDKQDAASITDQVRRCRKYADDHDLEVVAEYSDEARSGATMRRNGLTRLLSAAGARDRQFTTILVYDLARLSRDLGDTWQMVFGTLAAKGVHVIDCTTGRASNEQGARLTFGMTALVNDAFLDSTRVGTHRGLERRAHADYHTGGRCFGYSTTPVPNPGNAESPYHVLVIDDGERVVVLRIFTMYAEGAGFRQIAATLNVEGILAPYDKDKLGYRKAAGRGWSAGTIRAILQNKRYIGKLTWNRRQWYRDPLTKKKKYKTRPEAEWITHDRPEIRIVDDLLWKRVQLRIGRREKRDLGTPRHREERSPSPLSGLLWCGCCGSRMTVAGGGKGGLYRNFKCAANHVKGAEVCGNSTGIAEVKTLAGISSLLSSGLALLDQRQAFQRFTSTFRRLLSERTRATATPPTELSAVEADIKRESAAVGRLLDALVDAGKSEALLQRLRETEARLETLKARREGMQAPVAASKVPLPSADRLRSLFHEVEAALQSSPEEAQAALGARLGKITLTPKETEDGPVYVLETTFKMEPAALIGGGRTGTLYDGCGARI
jgi:site-specific DNA recombinase